MGSETASQRPRFFEHIPHTGRWKSDVIIDRKSWPKDRPWIVGISLVSGLACIGYGAEWVAESTLPGGSSRCGFLYGLAGGLIILFELLLWPRKNVRSWRIGSAQTWLRAHVWLGLLAVPLVLMHARLFWIGGLFNWTLMILFVAVIASGIWGLALQQFLPRMLMENVPSETIYDQIAHVAAKECLETDRLVRAMCEVRAAGSGSEPHPGEDDDVTDDDEEFAVVTGFRSMTGIQGKVIETVPIYGVIPGTQMLSDRYFSVVRPYLQAGCKGGSALSRPLETAKLFVDLRAGCPAQAAIVIDHLESVCALRRQFDLQIRLHHWLHGWLLIHVPLSVALGVLLAIHVPVALMYW